MRRGRQRDRGAREQGCETEGRGVDVVKRELDQKTIVFSHMQPLHDAFCVGDQILECQIGAFRTGGRAGGEEYESFMRKIRHPGYLAGSTVRF